MNARTSVAVATVLVLAGCLGGAAPAPAPTSTATGSDTTADASVLRVVSIGQDENATADEVTVRFATQNTGDTAVQDATATVALLNGESELVARTVSLGDLAPGATVSLSVTFDVDTERIDGRRITFGTA